VSGRIDELKEYRDENWSGSYSLTGINLGKPVYKVSFILSSTNCKIKIMILILSGIKELNVMENYIFIIREVIFGI